MAKKSNEKPSVEQVLAQAKSGELAGEDLAGLSLKDTDLAQAKLAGADLSRTKLAKAVLREADLSGANLSKADLTRADLSQANLQGADLSGCKAKEANFSSADLRGATLNLSHLGQVDLTGANLAGAVLIEANLTKARIAKANLRKADLNQADLSQSTIEEADFCQAKAFQAVFHDAEMRQVDMTRLDGNECVFSDANFNEVDLSEAKLENADFSGGLLDQVKLRKALLAKANFVATEHKQVDLEGANLENAVFKFMVGYTMDEMFVFKERGAKINLFLLRRFWRLFKKSGLVKAVTATIMVLIGIGIYLYISNPMNWPYDVLTQRIDQANHAKDYDKVLKYNQVILEKYADAPDKAMRAKLGLAEELRRRGNYEQAEKAMFEVYEDYNYIKAISAVISLYIDMEEYEKADKLLLDMLDRRGLRQDDRVLLYMERTRLYERQGQYDQAAKLMEEQLEKFEDPFLRHEAMMRLGKLYEANRQYEKAENLYQRMLEEFKGDDEQIASILLAMGHLFSSQGERQKADEYFTQVAERFPENNKTLIDAKTAMANQLRKHGEWDKAEQMFRSLYEEGKDFWTGILLADLLQQREKMAEAENLLASMKREYDVPPNEVYQILFRQAQIYQKTERPQEAIKVLTDLVSELKNSNNLLQATSLLAEIYFKTDQMNRLAELEKTALDRLPENDSEARGRLSLDIARLYSRYGMHDEAQTRYLQVAKLLPEHPLYWEAIMGLASVHKQRDEMEQTEKLYRQVWEGSHNYWAATHLLDIMRKEGRFEEAFTLIDDLQQRFADHIDWMQDLTLRRVALLESQKKYDEAIALLTPQLDQFDQNSHRYDALDLLARLYTRTGDLKKAGELYQQLADSFAEDTDKAIHARLNSARALREAGQFDEALTGYQNIVDQFPDNRQIYRAYLGIADIYRAQKQFDKAINLYRQVWEQEKIYWAGIPAIDILTSERKFDEALAMIVQMEQALEEGSEDREDLIVRRARLLSQTGRQDEAIALLKEKLDQFYNPDKIYDGHAVLAEIYLKNGKPQEALALYQKLSEYFADDQNKLFQIKYLTGKALSQTGENERSLQIYSALLEEVSDHQKKNEIKLEMANTMRKLNQFEQAKEIYRDVWQKDDNYWAAVSLADVLNEQGKPEQALAVYDQLGKHSEQKEDILWRRINVFLRLDRKKQAKDLLEKNIDGMENPGIQASMLDTLARLYREEGDTEKAREIYQRIGEAFPQDTNRMARAQLEIGFMQQNNNEIEQATQTFRQIIEEYPDNEFAVEAKVALGQIELKKGNRQQAQEQFRRVWAQDKHYNAGSALVGLLRDGRQFDEALSVIDQMQQVFRSTDWQAENLIIQHAEILEQAKRNDETIQYLQEKLPQLRDRNIRLRANNLLAKAYANRDELNKAVAILQAIIKENPQDKELKAQAAFDIARFYQDQNMPEKAIDAFQDVIRRYGDHKLAYDAQLNLGQIYRSAGKNEKAIATIRKAWNRHHQYQAGAILSDFLRDNNRNNEALTLLKQMQRKFSKNKNFQSDIIVRQANVLDRAQRVNEAITLLNQHLDDMDDKNIRYQGYEMLARLYAKKGNTEKVEQIYNKMLTLFADNPDHHGHTMLSKARFLYDRDRHAEAETLFQDIIAKYPDLHYAHEAKVQIAQRLLKKGELDQAAAMFREAWNDSKMYWAGIHLAEIMGKKNQPDQALAFLNQMQKEFTGRRWETNDLIVRRTRLMVEQEMYGTAIDLLTQRLPKIKDVNARFEAYKVLAEAYLAKGQKEKVVEIGTVMKKEFAGDEYRTQYGAELIERATREQ